MISRKKDAIVLSYIRPIFPLAMYVLPYMCGTAPYGCSPRTVLQKPVWIKVDPLRKVPAIYLCETFPQFLIAEKSRRECESQRKGEREKEEGTCQEYYIEGSLSFLKTSDKM